jgi:hypothetical protein
MAPRNCSSSNYSACQQAFMALHAVFLIPAMYRLCTPKLFLK